MKKISIALFCVLIFIACSTQKKYGYSIKKISHEAGGLVTYRNYDVCYQEELKSCKNQMLDSFKTAQKLKNIPKNGWINIQTGAYTLEAAKPENHIYIIQDSLGNEILRLNGQKGKIPNFTTNAQTRVTTWGAYDAIPLDVEINTPFRIFLVNKVTDKRSEFLITKASN